MFHDHLAVVDITWKTKETSNFHLHKHFISSSIILQYFKKYIILFKDSNGTRYSRFLIQSSNIMEHDLFPEYCYYYLNRCLLGSTLITIDSVVIDCPPYFIERL